MFEITPLSRRSAMVVLASGLLLLSCSTASAQQQTINVAAFDRIRVLKAANQYLSEKPFTVTASPSSRSAGGLHDFFSEGDYW